MLPHLGDYARKKLLEIAEQHSEIVAETIFEMSPTDWNTILQEVESKLLFRPFGFNDLHDFFNSPSTDEEAEDIILRQIFHREKLTDSECAALNYVIGFNCYWCRKDEKKTFLHGSWRWMARWIAGLCEEKKDYLDYYCRGLGGLNRDRPSILTNIESSKKGWLSITSDEERIADFIVDKLKELGWVPISLER